MSPLFLNVGKLRFVRSKPTLCRQKWGARLNSEYVEFLADAVAIIGGIRNLFAGRNEVIWRAQWPWQLRSVPIPRFYLRDQTALLS